MDEAVTPFTLRVEQSELDALSQRLALTRWPEPETVTDWSQGVPLSVLQPLIAYWGNGYDWRRCEALLNGFGQFRTPIDGIGVHFLHVRSAHADALPLVMSHGWPGSVLEFAKVIAPLVDPTAHGGSAADAFHVVVPSLPGYGFSDRPGETGWNVPRIARAWAVLMQRLGYDRYVAEGGDWGSAVTMTMGRQQPEGLLGIHSTMAVAIPPPGERGELTPQEQASLARSQAFRQQGSGYSGQQSTRPQTLGYALADSPVGQAAWIFEKYREWTDCGGDPFSVLTRDEILDAVMMYWLPNTATSSARLYWENGTSFGDEPITLPSAITVFPQEIFQPSRRWAERIFRNIVHWSEPARGGHFAALEVPDLFVSEVRAAFRSLR